MTYFQFFASRSLCFDLFILVLSLLVFSALDLVFPRFNRKNCLQIFKTEDALYSYVKSIS